MWRRKILAREQAHEWAIEREKRKQQVGVHTLAIQPVPVDLATFFRNYKREL